MQESLQPQSTDAVLGGEAQQSQKPTITTERAVKMLRGGDAGIRQWNQFRQCEDYLPSFEGVDLSGQSIDGANLSSTNFKNSNLSQIRLKNVWFQASLCWRVKLEKEVGRKK